jgi:ferredoxin
MRILQIQKTDWAAGLEKSRKDYSLIGPVREGNNTSKFKRLAAGEEPDFSITTTTMSPKSVVFPQSEVMFTYTTDNASPDCNIMKVPERSYSRRAVIGIRPFDAAAMLIVKMNFDTPDYRDPYWCDAYEACTFIGLAVTDPEAGDFSSSTNCGPFSTEGLDVLLVDMGDSFLAEILSEKGEAWAASGGFDTEAGKDAEDSIAKMRKEAEKKINSTVEFEKIDKKDTLELYNENYWDSISFPCLNCGTCTYVCPTCWCFDIQDETAHKKGRRMKNWDSCMFPNFTIHTTGHNPRGTKLMRVRQRFMHKLKYHQSKYEKGIMCVGCGRCITSCPVNIDIREVCKQMNS